VIEPIDIPIIGESSKLPQDDPSFTLNFYGEQVSKDVFTLKPTPGSEVRTQLSVSGGGRGLIVVAGRLFGVRGGYLQEIVNDLPVIRGALNTNAGRVAMVANIKPDNARAQILIVDDGNGYVFDLSDNSYVVLTGVGGDDFLGGGSQAAVCAGKAYVFKPGTTFFQSSNAYDFKVWNTSANTSMQSLSRPLLALASNGDLLYGWSEDGFEVWQEQGLSVTLLSVRQVLAGDKIGILAPFSALFIERHAYWLGKTSTGEGVIYRHTGGGAPERISNHAYERQIAALSDPGDCLGDTYSSLGHVFYLLTFRAGNVSICWDKTTNLWHNRAQRDPSTGSLFALPYFSFVILDGDILAIDYRNGKVVSVDNSIYQDEGNPIRRDRKLSVFPSEADYMTYFQSVELFAQVGNTPVGQDDPQIMFRYSTDRGETWSLEDWQVSGGDSTYSGRTRWIGMGAAYGLVPWFSIVANQFVSWRSVRVRAE
jgi:hypothetical protein